GYIPINFVNEPVALRKYLVGNLDTFFIAIVTAGGAQAIDKLVSKPNIVAGHSQAEVAIWMDMHKVFLRHIARIIAAYFCILSFSSKMYNLCARAGNRFKVTKVQLSLYDIWIRMDRGMAHIAKRFVRSVDIIAGAFASAERIS